MIRCPQPHCRHDKTEVLKTDGATRRRRCLSCGHRWLTVEQHAVDLGELVGDVVRRVRRPEPAR